MDLEQALRKLAKYEQLTTQSDKSEMNRMRTTIHKRLQQKQRPIRFVAVPVVVVVLFVVFWGVGLETVQPNVDSGENIAGENHKLIEYTLAPVNSERLTKIISSITSYSDLEIKNTGASLLAGVFLQADEASLVETNKGKLQVIMFPENFNAEQIELDEDLTRAGNITYTFSGTELNEELLPLRATGPTYVFAKSNMLFVTNNSSLVDSVRYIFNLQEIHTDILTSFGINPEQYDLYKQAEKRKMPGWSEKQLTTLTFIPGKIAVEELKRGDLIPAIFLKKGEPFATVIYQTAQGINQLRQYRWNQATETWTLVEKKSIQGIKASL